MNKIAAFVLSLFLCACNSSQKANMDNIISFEGINIETDITSFCDSLEKAMKKLMCLMMHKAILIPLYFMEMLQTKKPQ